MNVDKAAVEYLEKCGLAEVIQKMANEKPEDPLKFLVGNIEAMSLEDPSPVSAEAEIAASFPVVEAAKEGKDQRKISKKEKKQKPKKKQDHTKGGGVVAKKSKDVHLWYEQVITKSEMMDYYPVKGCYIYRPWAYKTWGECESCF